MNTYITKILQCSYRKLIVLTFIIFVSNTGFSQSEDIISRWNESGIYAANNSSGSSTIDLAYLHIALFDAVNAVEGKYEPFLVTPSSASGWASPEAAASAAAHDVLLYLYPTVPNFLDSVFTAEISMLPADSTTLMGIEIGKSVAERLIEMRKDDGRLAEVQYTFLPPGPGIYQLTPGAPDPPATPAIPWVGRMHPFAIDSASQFRPAGPPPLDSEEYARDFNEVKSIGSKTSGQTAEQDDIVLFHTENTNNQYSRIVRNFVAGQELPVIESARLFAQIFVSMSDAIIAGVEAKYYFNFWRPVTAIHQAGTDGNPATEPDTSWQPYLTTPNHQEYVSTHCCYIGAFAGALEHYYGTSDIEIEFTSEKTNTKHLFRNTQQLLDEMNNARIWGGMHFRTSNEHGLQIGREVADYIAVNKFKLVTDAPSNEVSPVKYTLEQNYPNPFNPSTHIRYSLPTAGHVSIKVYDLIGREAAELVNGYKPAGIYETEFDASALASGTYFYTLKTGSFTQTKKLLLIK